MNQPSLHRKQYLLTAAALLLLWAMGSSCAEPSPDGVSLSPSSDERLTTTEVNLVGLTSKIAIYSFSELASYSRVIVLGRVVSKEGIFNSSRLGDDHSKTGDDFNIAQVYLVEVERYLKGEGPETLHLVQFEGRLLRKVTPEETPSPDEIEQAKAAAEGKDYIPLKLGNRYLFFLWLDDDEDYDVGGYRANRVYSPAKFPWKFDASDLENIRYEEGDPDRFFPADLSLDEIIAQINATPTPPPYPPPQATPAGLPYPSP